MKLLITLTALILLNSTFSFAKIRVGSDELNTKISQTFNEEERLERELADLYNDQGMSTVQDKKQTHYGVNELIDSEQAWDEHSQDVVAQ